MRALLLALLIACGAASDPPPPSTIQIELVAATPADLAAARQLIGQALLATPDDAALLAQLAYVEGLAALLYGNPVPQERIFAPIAPGAPGYRAWVLGKVAYGLTTATKPEQLAELSRLLVELAKLEKPEKPEPWRRWLEARIALLRGDRVAAASILRELTIPPARIDYALFLAEEGKDREAARSLGAVGDNVLAVVVGALLDVERGETRSATLQLRDLKGDLPPRAAAFRSLVDAYLFLDGDLRPHRAAEVLAKLGRIRTPPNECAFWERVAWLHLQLGRNIDRTNDHKIAGIARTRCAALGKATGENRLLVVLDASLQLGLGRPDIARQLATRVPSLWGNVMRAYAELELGNPAAVPPLLADRAALARSDSAAHRTAEALTLQAEAQLATGKARSQALAKLDALAHATSDLRARHALGAALFAVGDLEAAQRELRLVVETTSETSVDPLAYRTHQLLAEIALANDDLGTAGHEIDRAIAIHPGNVTSYVVKARVLLRAGDPERALDALAPLRKRGELVPAAKLVAAEALVTQKVPTVEHRTQAKALVLEVVGKLPPAEVGRVAALVDPKLPAELKLPIGKLPKQRT